MFINITLTIDDAKACRISLCATIKAFDRPGYVHDRPIVFILI